MHQFYLVSDKSGSQIFLKIPNFRSLFSFSNYEIFHNINYCEVFAENVGCVVCVSKVVSVAHKIELYKIYSSLHKYLTYSFFVLLELSPYNSKSPPSVSGESKLYHWVHAFFPLHKGSGVGIRVQEWMDSSGLQMKFGFV
ncbi:hypothetical protein BpHYR1_036626 [Brachionus plicatilis]|uniref:Uncharacterized protein n=1 Tax=Brachionus plicatilis TaxID=10195 RepID=A0A3M7RTP8_BRAPC|nr:hypothetical protein BpHYR1_036626 [Brachionus plicatilis]